MGKQKQNWTADRDGAAISGELRRILGVSHRQAKGLVDAGCVAINSEKVRTYGHRLKVGDTVAVTFDPDSAYHESPRPSKSQGSAVKILWEDKHLVFVDKPAGILSVPTEHSNDASLADFLEEHYRETGIKKPRIYIAHRIDRFTTGVMVFAKTPEALSGLKDIFSEHSLHRIYKAILVGELPENIGTLHDKLVERTRRLKMAVAARRSGSAMPQGAKPAVTHYRVIERMPGHTVVELRLETGRRNQIRVQFSERGYPILGDQIYGSASKLIARQALHAETLGLRHPVSGEDIEIRSEMPEDMEAALKRLRVARRVQRAKDGILGEEGLFKPRKVWDGQQKSATLEKKIDKERMPRIAAGAKTPIRPSRAFGKSERDPSKSREKGVPKNLAKTRRPPSRHDEPTFRSSSPKPLRAGRKAFSSRDKDTDSISIETSGRHRAEGRVLGTSERARRDDYSDRGRKVRPTRSSPERSSKYAEPRKPRRPGSEGKKSDGTPRGQRPERRAPSFSGNDYPGSRKTTKPAQKSGIKKFDKAAPRPAKDKAKRQSAFKSTSRAPKRKA
jgi:23S rRNA pseudouridine1911/1915/1917 synthase